MATLLRCYHLDSALDRDELTFVSEAMLGPWSRFKLDAYEIVQHRVPAVLPLPGRDGQFIHSPEHRSHLVTQHLRHAGMERDINQRVVWVTPENLEWDAIFQHAIRSLTGFAPFVVQRWSRINDVAIPVPLRIIDAEMLLRGLET